MTGEIIAFGLVAAALVASSLAVVLTPNLFHAVLYLAVSLVATGIVFLLLEAPFLFGVQLLLYAGGVVTIVVFAIMLTERLVGASIRQTSRYVINGGLVSAAVFVFMISSTTHNLPAQSRRARYRCVPREERSTASAVVAVCTSPWAVVGPCLRART